MQVTQQCVTLVRSSNARARSAPTDCFNQYLDEPSYDGGRIGGVLDISADHVPGINFGPQADHAEPWGRSW
jgi:hypothetical protein